MVFRIDIKSLIVGLLIGLAVIFVLGAASGSNKGVYQFRMAAFSRTDASDAYVVYGRMHTGTGKIEAWRYSLRTSKVIPPPGDNPSVLIAPDSGNR